MVECQTDPGLHLPDLNLRGLGNEGALLHLCDRDTLLLPKTLPGLLDRRGDHRCRRYPRRCLLVCICPACPMGGVG